MIPMKTTVIHIQSLEYKILPRITKAPHSWGFLFVGLWVDLD